MFKNSSLPSSLSGNSSFENQPPENFPSDNASPGFVLVTATRYLIEEKAIVPDEVIEKKTPFMPPYACVENQYSGWVIVTNQDGFPLHCTPMASEGATFFRSSAKPFQAFPLTEPAFQSLLTSQELAIACASHNGSAMAMEWVNRLLEKAGLTEAALQCGPHTPFDSKMKALLRQTGDLPSPLHNNCSGKHAGKLLYCKKNGLDLQTYLDPEHPLQQKIIQVLKQWGGVTTIPLAVDGCGAPVFYLPLKAMARLYAHLGSTKDFAQLRDAMLAYPELIGGPGRVDTAVMQATHSKILVKCGADGVVCAARVESGEGLALKISDGSTEVRNMALVEILIRLGWITSSEKEDPRLFSFREQKKRLNTQGKVVGDFQVHFEVEK